MSEYPDGRIPAVPASPLRLGWRRRAWGLAVAGIGGPLLTAVLLPFRVSLGLDTVLLFFVLMSVAASAAGGIVAGLVASLLNFGLANVFFASPYGTLIVASGGELLDLVVFLAVAALVGVIAEVSAWSLARTERRRLEAAWLADLGSREFAPDSVDVALAETRRVFGVHSATLAEDGVSVAAAGEPEDGDAVFDAPAGEGLTLELRGPERIGLDRALLTSLALTTGRLWHSRRLAEQARHAEELARIDEVRSSLLAAVGHDLRNPLAAITAAAATLRQHDIVLGEEERDELMDTVVEHAGRLDAIIANLLDMSRLQAGVVSVLLRPTDVMEVMTSIVGLGERVGIDVPEGLPLVFADAGLLERVLANLVDNALRHERPGERVRVRAGLDGPLVRIAVSDTGPGVPVGRREGIFAPFQHFDDRTTTGVGLGLAISRGFTEAMGGTLVASETPGGGLTMTVSLEAAVADR
ncbi:sensor histidine kinase [Propionicicella superfundia]|uniref:sensor histidine kinase n=1 Tax=Propionicicella superfundia TaxID=348582 RepID=UPI00146AED40|nr:ATP-binding protein [Propionicicella superfundia]